MNTYISIIVIAFLIVAILIIKIVRRVIFLENKLEKKTLNIKSLKDFDESKVEIFGNPDIWTLMCKASNKSEGWMKSTKVMEVHSGCLIQVSTKQGNYIAESVTYVPGVKIYKNGDDVKLVSL